MNSEIESYLSGLLERPRDLTQLAELGQVLATSPRRGPEVSDLLRKNVEEHRKRGNWEAVLGLIDLQLSEAHEPLDRVELLTFKAKLLEDELLDEARAVAALEEVLSLAPDHGPAREALEKIVEMRENWEKVAEGFASEARAIADTDRKLASEFYLSAAELIWRQRSDDPRVDRYLQRCLEVNPRKQKAVGHVVRRLQSAGDLDGLLSFLDKQSDGCASREERIAALLTAAELLSREVNDPAGAAERYRRVLKLDPAHPQALQALMQTLTDDGKWSELLDIYEDALRRKPDKPQQVELLALMGSLCSSKLGDKARAEDYFRRVRRLSPTHPAMLQFYRELYRESDELGKLLAVIDAAFRAETDGARKVALAKELAAVAEEDSQNFEKAIDIWKGVQRLAPADPEPIAALKRLYSKTTPPKWNALRELIKDQIDQLAPEATDEKIDLLMEIVAIYRDHLGLDVMVVNTFNAILELKPDHRPAIAALKAKYTSMGRWNDLVSLLGRQKDAAADTVDKIEILREIAALWTERFGNQSQAIIPLREILSLSPGDAVTHQQLEEIYKKRRSFSELYELLQLRAAHTDPQKLRDVYADLARLGANRLGAIEDGIHYWNRVLAECDAEDPEALDELATLYQLQSRWPALAEVLHRLTDLESTEESRRVELWSQLGSIYSEKLHATENAVQAWRAVLELDPKAKKARAVLMELYFSEKRFDELEELYAARGEYSELCEKLNQAADRSTDNQIKTRLYLRVGEIYRDSLGSVDRAIKAFERVQAIDSAHPIAAHALIPLYRETERWARLLPVYEGLYERSPDKEQKLHFVREILELYETHLESRQLAFAWCAKAFALDPEDADLRGNMERLAAAAEAWDELVQVYVARCQQITEVHARSALLRHLAFLCHEKLHRADQAEVFYRDLLQLEPDDRSALQALERIYTTTKHWAGLVEIFSKQALLALQTDEKVSFLFKVAFLQEERLGAIDEAIGTLKEILDHAPQSERALKTLSRLYEVRGEWFPLVEVCRRQLSQTADRDEKVEILLRLGDLLQHKLNAVDEGIAALEQALALDPVNAQVVRNLEPHLQDESPHKARVARLLRSFYERSEQWARVAQVLTILLGDEQSRQERANLLRARLRVERRSLADPEAAFASASELFKLVPDDERLLAELLELGDALGEQEGVAELVAEAVDDGAAHGMDHAIELRLRWRLCEIYDEQLGTPEAAEPHLRRILEMDEQRVDAFEMLERVLRDLGAWDELRLLLERRYALCEDVPLQKDILLQIAALDENVLEDIPRAISSYESVLDLDPDDVTAIRALERHYAAEKRHHDLLSHYRRQLERQTDANRSRELKLLQARLLWSELREADAAIDLLEEIVVSYPRMNAAVDLLEEFLQVEDQRVRVADILDPVYERREEWQNLDRILELRATQKADRFEVAAILARMAEIREVQLKARERAFEAHCQALLKDPGAVATQNAIHRLAEELGDAKGAAQAWQDAMAVADPADVALRAQFLLWRARLLDTQLGERALARECYEQLLALDPANVEAVRESAAALVRIYEEVGAHRELIDVLSRQVEWTVDSATRARLWQRVAELSEEVIKDVDAAISAYRRLIDEEPGSPLGLDALERLYTAQARFPELIELLKTRIELCNDASARQGYWMRIAELQEQTAGEWEAAVASYLAALDEAEGDLPAMRALCRLYREHGDWGELLVMLERQLGAAPDDTARTELLLELGELEQNRLHDATGAVQRYRRILELDPQNNVARTALEGLLKDTEQRGRAARILLPLCERNNDWAKVAEIHDLLAECDEPRERLDHLKAVAELAELKLSDDGRAFERYATALPLSAAEPDLLAIFERFKAISERLGRPEAFVSCAESTAVDVVDGDARLKIHLELAELCDVALGDARRAREHYERVLELAPDRADVLTHLDRLNLALADWSRLLEVLNRRTELAPSTDDRVALTVRMAHLTRERLEQPVDAIVLYEQVLELQAGNEEAFDQLDVLYTGGAQWGNLDELLVRRLAHIALPAQRTSTLLRLGRLRERELLDRAGALAAYREVLAQEPQHEEAALAIEAYLDDVDLQLDAATVLEPFYVARQDWPKLIRIYEIRLAGADDPERRRALSTRIAQLYEEQLEDLSGAFTWYSKVYLEKPEDTAIRDQILRLAGILGRWDEAAAVFAQYLESTYATDVLTRNVALLLGGIYDEKLYDVNHAAQCYDRVLEHDPNDGEAFEALESLLTRAERWERLLTHYRDAADAQDEPGARRELLLKICRVWEEALDNLPEAIDAYRHVLDEFDSDLDATPALERLYAASGRWHDLCELFARQLERAPDNATRIALHCQLGITYEERLDDLPSAIDQFEAVLGLERHNDQAIAALERMVLDRDQRLRIALILEPIYLEQDEWAKLVVIYDAQLDFVDDPDRRGFLLREIARLHEERNGDLELAFRALSRAFQEAYGDPPLLEQLERLAAKRKNFADLIQVLEAGVGTVYENDLLARMYDKIARLKEEHLSDRDGAVRAYRQVLAADEGNVEAVDQLVRLLGLLGRHQELIEALERRAELVHDLEQQKASYFRAAEIREEVLGEVEGAIELYRQVLARDDHDSRALRALERLYRQTENWLELIWTLRKLLQSEQNAEARRALQLRVAQVYERNLADSFEAIASYKDLLDQDSGLDEVLDALDRLYAKESLYADLLDVVDRKLARVSGVTEQNELDFRAGRVLENQLSDPAQAIERYTRVLSRDRQHGDALEALEQIVKDEGQRRRAAQVLELHYQEVGDAKALIGLLELLLELGTEPADRRDLLTRMAVLHELRRENKRAAFETYARALAEDPGDASIQQALERLAAELGDPRSLVDVYEARLAELYEPRYAREFHVKVARIAESELTDWERAERHYREVLDSDGDDGETLAALCRALRELALWDQLAEALERRIQVEPRPEEQAALCFQLGEVLREHQSDLDGAFAAYREALARDPGHAAARQAMRTHFLHHEAYAVAALDVLEPIAAQRGEHDQLVELFELRLKTAMTPIDRLELLERIADVHEQRRNDRQAALGAIQRAISEDLSASALIDRAEGLAEQVGGFGSLASFASGLLGGDRANREAASALGLRVATWYGAKLNDVEQAERTLRRVLEIDPQLTEAWERLEQIYRATVDAEHLAECLSHQAELTHEAERRSRLLVELAQLREHPLCDSEGAVSAWEAVLDLDPHDGEALSALSLLFRERGQFELLCGVLEKRAQLADSVAERKALKHGIGQVLLEQLGDLGRAAEVYRDIMDLDPKDAESSVRLEEIHRCNEDWGALQEVLMWRLEQVSTEDKVPIFMQLASLCLDKLRNVDEAVGFLHELLLVDPHSSDGRRMLERTLETHARWYDLVDLHKQHAEVLAKRGDARGQIEALARTARIWNDHLENPDAAGEVLEQILSRDPDNVVALAGLARIYESTAEWARCSEVLARAAALNPGPEDAAEIEFRLGRVKLAQGPGNAAGEAEAHFRRALEHFPGHAEANAVLEASARGAGAFGEVARLLELRLTHQPLTEPEMLATRLELGTIYAERLGDGPRAVACLEAARALDPENVDVLGALADGYFAAGRLNEAEPLLEQLIKVAGTRRRKELGRYTFRLGTIAEQRGNHEAAREQYDKAYRLDSTNGPVLVALGRVYLQQRRWEDARRIYRSMLLQHMSTDAGISKAEVFYRLGQVHVALGEGAKAKSMFERGLELEPTHEGLRTALAAL